MPKLSAHSRRQTYYMKKLITTCFAISLLMSGAYAQREFGVAESNWSGTNALYLNPANGADNREKFSIDLFGLNVGADNNLGTFASIPNLINRIFSGSSNSVSDVFKYTNGGNFSLLAPYVEVRGPGILINIKQKHTLALTTRVRAMVQFNNFGSTLYQIISEPSSVSGRTEYPVYNKDFNWTAHLWSDVGLTYSTILLDKGRNRLKFGVTARYLGGIGYIGLKGNNLDVYYKVSNDSLHATNSDFQYASNVLSTNNAFVNGLTNTTLINSLFGSKSCSGLGADFGFVYEYRTNYEDKTYDMDGKTGIVDYSRNHYKFRISASVTDLGYINYNSGNFSANVSGNGSVTGKEIGQYTNNFPTFINYVRTKGFTADTAGKATKVYMPTAMLLSFDYHAAKRVYVNLTYVANLANRQNFGTSFYNQVTVTPRYDIRNFSFGLPLTYSVLANDFKMGFGARLHGFFIGSDDVMAFFSNNHYGFNLYTGFHVPINHHIPRDRDGDGVSDRKDKCPSDPGTWETRGCPEADSEHGGSNDDSLN